MQVGREGGGWDDWVVAQLVVVLELTDLREDLQGVAPAAMHSDLLVTLVEVVNLLGTQTAVQLFQRLALLEMCLLELEIVGLADC